jgi:hypothetical protein
MEDENSFYFSKKSVQICTDSLSYFINLINNGFRLPFYDNASQVNPLPKAAKTTVSPDLILPFPKLPLKQLVWQQSYFRTFEYYTLDHRSIQISFE